MEYDKYKVQNKTNKLANDIKSIKFIQITSIITI